MASRIQVRRDTSDNWSSVNPILAQGEYGLNLDSGKVKCGDGITAWNDLDYCSPSQAEFDEHKAENVSQLVVVTRDTTLAGIQTVSFTRKPKRIDVLSLVIGTKKFSVGNVSSNSQGCIFHTEEGVMFGNGNYAIVLGEAEANNISGAITINADNTVSINWTKIGAGTTGTASIRLIAHYHD
jgi:hypothetical protein